MNSEIQPYLLQMFYIQWDLTLCSEFIQCHPLVAVIEIVPPCSHNVCEFIIAHLQTIGSCFDKLCQCMLEFLMGHISLTRCCGIMSLTKLMLIHIHCVNQHLMNHNNLSAQNLWRIPRVIFTTFRLASNISVKFQIWFAGVYFRKIILILFCIFTDKSNKLFYCNFLFGYFSPWQERETV